MVLHTTEVDVQRIGVGATVTVTLTCAFERTGTIGGGKTLNAPAFCALATGASVRQAAVLKDVEEIWTAPDVLSTVLTLDIPELGTAKKIALYIETYRSDSSNAAGTHSYSTELAIPAAELPLAPSITADKTEGMHTDPITVSVVNNSSGSGGVFGYTYQFRRAYSDVWVTFRVTQETSVVFYPDVYMFSPGDALFFRVALYNTLGAAAISTDVVRYQCVTLPLAPLALTPDSLYVTSDQDEIVFTVTDNGTPPAAYLVEFSLDSSGLWKDYATVLSRIFTMTPNDTLLSYGHRLSVRVRAIDTYGQISEPSPVCAISYYPKPYAISKAYAVPKRNQLYNPVQIYWTPATNAAQYRLEYSLDDTTWVNLATLTATQYSYLHQAPMITRIRYRVLPVSSQGLLPDNGWTYTDWVDVYGVEGYYKHSILLLKANVYAIINGESTPALQIVEV
jgi:hypothetical protein